jgi:Na+/phosphate symporter
VFHETAVKEQFSPIFEQLLAMVGAARNAFNRHSRGALEELRNLKGQATQEIALTLKQLEGLMAQKSEAERAFLLRLTSILTRLQIMAATLEGLGGPLQKKIKDGVLFSDKAVAQTNSLFDRQTGLLRTLLDILKTDNDLLKKYALEEARSLVQTCNEYATEHEARLIEGLCLPQAAPLFLGLLDGFRTVSQHEVDIALLLAQK